jgi:AraC-like DNA-binding protein
MKIGHVKFIRPKHKEVHKLIKGYYVHSAADPDFYAKVTFYQNITTTISVYKDSQTSSIGRLRKQHYKKDTGFNSLLVGLVDKYQEVEFHGPLDRIAIVFYPGGLNHFLNTPLSELLKKHYSKFNAFGNDFDQLLSRIYSESGILDKRDLLDDFFLNRLQVFQEKKILMAIDLLVNSPSYIKVENLAEILELNRRTLLRKFKKHLGYSIEEYMSVIKFRKALLNFQKKEEVKGLSGIALDSHYYDQADFNHQIKSRSELTPTQLFKQLEIVDDVLFWKV